MVTQIRKGTKPHLYIEQHIEARGLSFEQVGDRLGVSRTTVWRWAKEQWRLDPNKIAALAEAIGLESWQDLGRPPERPSIDGLLANASQETYEEVVDIAKRLMRRAS